VVPPDKVATLQLYDTLWLADEFRNSVSEGAKPFGLADFLRFFSSICAANMKYRRTRSQR
jgi:hypothetical protein